MKRAYSWMCVYFSHCAHLASAPGLLTHTLRSDLQHVELLKVVGRGSCGVVFRGTYGSRPVAVKLIEMLAEVSGRSCSATSACTERPTVVQTYTRQEGRVRALCRYNVAVASAAVRKHPPLSCHPPLHSYDLAYVLRPLPLPSLDGQISPQPSCAPRRRSSSIPRRWTKALHPAATPAAAAADP